MSNWETDSESGAMHSESHETTDASPSTVERAKPRVLILRDPHESPQKCSLIDVMNPTRAPVRRHTQPLYPHIPCWSNDR